jgi:DNA-binding transcriptional LysR family regulator
MFLYMKSIKGIDLRHFAYFTAVAEQKSFSRAARQLNISQPPLSAQIKDMEARIGAKLFLRDRRGVELTEAGRALLPEARALIAKAQDAVRHTGNVAKGKAGRIRLGMIGSGTYNPHMLACLEDFAKKMPGVQLDILQLSSLGQRRALAEGEIDLGFHWPWPGRASAEFDTRVFPAQELQLAVPVRHPLAKKSAADPADFAHETWLAPAAKYNPSWHEMTLNVFRSSGFTPVRLIEESPAPLLLSMVAAGQGVALLPSFMKPQSTDARGSGIVLLPLIRACRDQVRINLCLSKRRMHRDGLIASFFRLAEK